MIKLNNRSVFNRAYSRLMSTDNKHYDRQYADNTFKMF
jgi:hypothetical protein